MTLTYGVLRVLEPGQVPPLSGVTLMSIERTATARPEDKLFATEEAAQGWQVIVIHDSQHATGSYDTIDKAHLQAGKTGCGYHFVINNGSAQQEDGRIEVGYRWKYQQAGDFFEGPEADAFNQRFKTIGICLVGDLDAAAMTPAQERELLWLVGQLSERYGIPADRVFVDVGRDGDGVGTHFPYARFRAELTGATLAEGM